MAILSAEWSCITSNARLCRSSQAVSVIGPKVYVFGGELEPRQPVDNRVDVVNLNNDSGSPVQTISAPSTAPSPRVGSPSTKVNGLIWLFSGRGGLEMKPVEEDGALWCYDVANSEWNMVQPSDSSAPYPSGRSYHCTTSDSIQTIFIHAGCPESGRLADLWKFDVETKVWSELPSAPGPARGGASIAYLDGKIYRMNGFDGNTEQGGTLDIFDIRAGSWNSVDFKTDDVQGPKARSVATMLPLSVGQKSYLITAFGEHSPSSLGHAGAGKMLSDVWAWDIEQSQWQKLVISGNSPQPRGWFDADVIKDENDRDVVIVHGGLSEWNQRLGDVWRLVVE